MLDPVSFRSVPANGFGSAYDEDAFRHFLSVDRSRALRLRRVLYLVLVALRQSPGRNATLSDASAAALFRGLGASVREVDYVGWYQQRQIAAAVLPQGATATGDVRPVIAGRVLGALTKQLPGLPATALRVRVVRLGASVGN